MPLAEGRAEGRTRPAAPGAGRDPAGLARLGRLYLLLSRINEAVAGGGDPAKVCAAVCTMLVRDGGTRCAVIRVHDRLRGALVPLASSGPTRGWVGGRSVELDNSTAHSARAARERCTVLIGDLLTATVLPGAVEDARAVGVRASIAIPLLAEGEVDGVMTLYAATHDHFDAELVRMLEQAGASVASLFVRQRAARQRADTEARYGEMLAALPSAVRVIQDGKVVMANPAAQRLLGASSVAELLGCDPLQHIVQEDRERVRQRLREARLTGKTMELARMRLLRADGTLCEIESTVVPCTYEGRPAVMAMARDITAQVRAELRLKREHDLYVALSKTNEAVLRAASEDDVCHAVCEIAVRHGGLVAAAIRRYNPRTRRLEHQCGFGRLHGMLGLAAIDLDDAASNAARTAREGSWYVCNDIATDPNALSSREDGARIGVRASAGFAMQVHGEMVGVMSVFAAEAGFFDDDLLKLLREMAGNVSVALEKLRAQQALESSEQRYRALFEASPVAIRVVRDERIALLNRAALDLLGYSDMSEARELPVLETVAPAWREQVRARLSRVQREGFLATPLEMELVRRDGGQVEVEVSSLRIDFEGRPAALSIIRDLTERSAAARRLKRVTDFYIALSHANEAIFRQQDLRLLCENVCEILVRHGGLVSAVVRLYDPAKQTLEPFARFGPVRGLVGELTVRLEDPRALTARCARTLESYFCHDLLADPQVAPARADALAVGVRSSGGVALQVGGGLAGLLSVYASEPHHFEGEAGNLVTQMARNLSFAFSRNRDAAALAQSNEHYRMLFEAIPDCLRVICEGKVVMLNPAGVPLFGLSEARDMLGREGCEFVHPDSRAQAQERVRQMLEDGRPLPVCEQVLLRADGKPVTAEVATLPFSYRGKPAVLSILRDLTERKSAARRLQRATSFYVALSHTNEAIFREPDLHALCERVCELAVRHGGLVASAVRMVDTTGLKLLPFAGFGPLRGWIGASEVTLDDPRSRAARCVLENSPYFSDDIFTDPTVAVAREDAQAVGVRSSGGLPLAVDGRVVGLFSVYAAEPAYFDEESARLVGVMARNLAFAFERRKRSDELARNSEHYRLLFESSPDAMRVVCEDRVVMLNPAGVTLFGLSGPEEMLGGPIDRFIPPQFLALAQARLRTVIEERKPVPLSQQQLCRPDGTIVDVEVITLPFIYQDRPAALSIVHDISERKAAESMARRMHAQLEERVAQRTEELHRVNEQLEAFSYTVAHDLRAPLRRISGFAGLLREQLGPRLADEDAQLMARLVDGAAQMNSLIDGLLEVAHAGNAVIHARHVSLTALAAEAAAALAARDPGRKVEIRIQPGMQAWADAQLLRDVMDNLLGNAWKFTSKVAVPLIQVGTLADGAAAGAPGSVAGHQVFYVRDNGAGFDPHYAAKLFGTFQRLHTQNEFPGNGIGLASVAAVIRHHGGRVWARGKPGEGATFFFSLPAGGEAPAGLGVAT